MHLLPSGVFYDHITNVIGHGVAFDLDKFFAELDSLLAAGVKLPRILVSDRAQLMLPYHNPVRHVGGGRLADKSFGSTKSGIAPFYSDKYLKVGIQVCELFDEARLRARLRANCEYKNLILKSVYNHGHWTPMKSPTTFWVLPGGCALLWETPVNF